MSKTKQRSEIADSVGVTHTLKVTVPDTWGVVPLETVLEDIVGGGTPSRENPSYWNGSIPWLTVKDMRTRRPEDSIDHISEQAVRDSATSIIPANTVIIATRIGLGKVIRVPYDAAINQDLKALITKPKVDKSYLEYWIYSIAGYLKSIGSGTTVKGVRLEHVRSLPFPLAPLDQQKRIVEEIEKQFSRLDEAVANLKRVKANLKRYKAAVLKGAVEGRLVETEAELARREGRSFETGGQLLKRIQQARRSQWQGKGKYKEPAVLDTVDLPELPEGWVWASVDQLAAPEPNSISDGPFGSNLKTEHYQESGPRVIRLQNIKDGEFADEHAHISPAHFDRLRKHEIHAGDLVIASLGDDPPRACIIPSFVGRAIVKADCIRFKPHSALTAAYLNAALNCRPTRQRVKSILHGIGRPRLSLGEIRAIALPIPPESEQHRIVAEIDRRLSIAAELEMQIEANLQRSDRARQSILISAFSGRLVLRDVISNLQSDLALLIAADKRGIYERSVKAKPSV